LANATGLYRQSRQSIDNLISARMSALGQKQTSRLLERMSALLPKADIRTGSDYVRRHSLALRNIHRDPPRPSGTSNDLDQRRGTVVMSDSKGGRALQRCG